MTPDATGAIRVLVVTGGHPYAADAFVSMFDALADIEYRIAVHPHAQDLLHPRQLRDVDVVVFSDMPGIVLSSETAPRFPMPSEKLVIGMRRLLAEGKPMLFLHRALAGWPAWREYSEIIGGKFLYSSDWVRGRRYPESGVRTAQTHTISPVDPTHRVVAGLAEGFTLTDELLLCPVFDQSFTPLLVSDADFSDGGFEPANGSASPTAQNWRHPTGSNVMAWARSYERSPVVYLQPGGGPSVFGHPSYRRLLSNAIAWLASPEAADWATEVR